MSRNLRAYITFVAVCMAVTLGAMVVAVLRNPERDLVSWLATGALFVGLCWLGSRQQLYYRDVSSISMGTTPQVAALLVLPYPIAILAVALGKFLSEVSIKLQNKRGRRRWRAIAVNLGGAVFANVAAGGVFLLVLHMMGAQGYLWEPGFRQVLALPALFALAVTYHVVDALPVVGAISLTSNDSPWSVFRGMFRGVLLPHLSLVFVGVVFAVLWHYAPALSLLIVVPVAFSIRSFESVSRLRKETVEAVLKMAESIDYRDTGTYEHSKRLADLTRRLSVTLGLLPDHVNDIVLASRVHDLGKIGISNEILLKPGSLSEQERRIMEEHPVIGSSILSSYSAFQSSVDVVRHHHERWDGKGYPDRLKGDAIPIGSRVVAVVDAFDSMTADRPYRQGMTVSAAVERLKDGMGAHFDPKVCAVFIQMLIEEGLYTPPESAPELHIVSRSTAS